ncbi:hypothetical protein LTR66_002861, partial [Elasticomyces elasticus]
MSIHPTLESWDDDADFDHDANLNLHSFSQPPSLSNSLSSNPQSASLAHSISSRLSLHSESQSKLVAGGSGLSTYSESNFGDKDTEDDWQICLASSDEKALGPERNEALAEALRKAQEKGIPLPANISADALLGGTIKKLGVKKSRQKILKIESTDWDDDLDLESGNLPSAPFVLRPKLTSTADHALDKVRDGGKDDDDAFDDAFDFQDGPLAETSSLGIRFTGPAKVRNRSASIASPGVMSPSLRSVSGMTIDSENEGEGDGLGGLELPEGPTDFVSILKRRKERAAADDDGANATSLPAPTQITQPKMQEEEIGFGTGSSSPFSSQPPVRHVTQPASQDADDEFFNDLDFGGGDAFDPKKLPFNRKINRNIKHKTITKPAIPAHRTPLTTLTFTATDKPASAVSKLTRLPRPVSGSKPPTSLSRLAPVLESTDPPQGAGHPKVGKDREGPLAGARGPGSNMLRTKRSMPALRSNQPLASKLASQIPPAPVASQVKPTSQLPQLFHSRTSSDPRRDRDGARSPIQSLNPPPRSFSRLSTARGIPHIPDTPSRTNRIGRAELAPSSQTQARNEAREARELTREATLRKNITKPIGLNARKKNWGDGSELEAFDDLPTSATKESKFIKAPVAKGPPRTLQTLRHAHSKSDVRESSVSGRLAMQTPVPQTPHSPAKFSLDRFQEKSETPRYLRDTAASRIARESRRNPHTNAADPPQQPIATTGSIGRNTATGYIKDLAAERGSLPRSRDGPSTLRSVDWAAKIAARSPHTSPAAQRIRNSGREVKKPTLIKPGMALDGLKLGSFDVLKLAPSLSVKKEEDHRKDGNASTKGTGMVFNPTTLRWDGNENALANFDREVDPPLETPTPAQHRHGKGSFFPNTQPPQHPNKPDTGSRNEYSPTRGLGKPALIAPLSGHNAGNNIQVVGGMVFDPRQMRWLKMSRERQHSRGPSDNGVMSPSITDGEEDEDPFAGIEDLKDTPIGVSSPPTTVADMTAGGKSVPA